MTDERGEMTPFGRTLMKLRVNHDLYEWKDLIAAVNGTGYRLTPGALSNYLYAERAPNDHQALLTALAQGMGLSEAERAEMAMAFAYSYRAPTEGNFRRAQEVEEEEGIGDDDPEGAGL